MREENAGEENIQERKHAEVGKIETVKQKVVVREHSTNKIGIKIPERTNERPQHYQHHHQKELHQPPPNDFT